MPGFRFSHLSAFRQRLVRRCQAINYGYIQRLEVKNSEPIFKPETLVYAEIKLDGDDCARSEVGLADFALPDEILRLMAQLDEIQNGVIEKIEVRAGVPRRLVYSSPPSGVLR
jgi:hypothetical protein